MRHLPGHGVPGPSVAGRLEAGVRPVQVHVHFRRARPGEVVAGRAGEGAAVRPVGR